MMREWLARKLYPSAFDDQRRLDYLRRLMDELSTWCGYGFPEVAAAIDWMKRSEQVYFMPLAEYEERIRTGRFNEVSVSDISRFRDEISDRFNRRPDHRKAS